MIEGRPQRSKKLSKIFPSGLGVRDQRQVAPESPSQATSGLIQELSASDVDLDPQKVSYHQHTVGVAGTKHAGQEE